MLGCGLHDYSGDDLAAGTETGGDTETSENPSTEGEEPECVVDSDCPYEYDWCEGGMCVAGEGPDEEECYVDEDCDEGQACLDLQCVAGLPTLEACAAGVSLTTTDVTTVVHPYQIALGDVDGQLGDEIVVYQAGSILSIATGKEPIVSPQPYGPVSDVIVLRADADASPDLLTAYESGLRRFVGDGAGGFSYNGGQTFEFELFALAKAAASGVDTLIGRSNTPNKDHQVFADPLAQAPSQTIPSDADPLTGDLDGDGIDELMVMNYDTLEIWTRDGDLFALATTINCAVEGFGSPSAAIGDLDDDGLDDVICMAGPSSSPGLALTVWSSLGELDFSAHPTVFAEGFGLDMPGSPTAAVANIGNDGRRELVFETGSFVALGDDGNFACHGPLGLADEFEVGDLDGDGRDELVTVDADELLQIHSFE